MPQIRAISVFLIGLCLASSAQEKQNTNSSKLYSAIRSGDVNGLKALLEDGVDPNVLDERGTTPLMNAAAVGSVEEMKILIQHGADVNVLNKFGATALMWSVRDPQRARLLVEHGADVNAVSGLGRTPLMIATVAHPSGEVVKMLLEKKARTEPRENITGFNAAMGALTAADPVTEEALFDALGDLNTGAKGSRQGYTPLMIAAGAGNVKAVKRLLAEGANVNARTPEVNPANRVKAGQVQQGGYTALILASTYGPPELVKALLDAGANVNAKDVRGMTPLMLSVTTDRLNPAITRILLDHGADTSVKSVAGETALDWARKYGSEEAIRMLGGRPEAPKPVVLRSSPPDPKTAVERSVRLLQRTSNQFFAESGCFACHAQTAAQIAQAAARVTGIEADPKAASELLEQMRSQMPPFLRQSFPAADAADTTFYLFEGLGRAGSAPDRSTDFVAAEVASEQWEDGGWHSRDGLARTPISDGDFSRTAMAIRILKTYSTPARAEESRERIQRAKQWLLRELPVTTEDWDMRLSGAALAGASPAEIQKLAEPILKRERADLGWSQREGLLSDAYATGMTLTALVETGAVGAKSAAFQNGVKFLLGTQAEDGSWHVASRAAKIQPYFESGFPYGHDQWISSMGTGWAATAVALAIDKPTKGTAR